MSDREFGGKCLRLKVFVTCDTDHGQVTTICRFLKVCHNPSSIAYYHILPMIPTATVQKIITEILPPSSGQVFARDARDLLIECCVEFITLISSEANDISEKEAKKTIAVEHIEKALTELGFQDYVSDVLAVADEFKDQQKVGSISLPGVMVSPRTDLTILVPRKEAEQAGGERHKRARAITNARTNVFTGKREIQRRTR